MGVQEKMCATVAAMMKPELTAIRNQSDTVAHRFGDTSVERLPVVDAEGLLLGTVSKRDLLRHGRF